MSRPDFMIIGAMKSGTSTLAAQLAAQDGVFVTTPKEPNYFSDDDVFARGVGWYESLYDDAPQGDCKGEASTHYTKLPTYPDTVARIKAYSDSMRFIYMIRNPLDRAISHLIHEWSERRVGRDAVTALEAVPELVDYGRYAYQITPYVEAFGAERIFLTSLEKIKLDPDGEMLRIGRFLGCPNPLLWKADLGASNVSAQRIRTFPLRRLLVDNSVMRPLRQALIPKSLRVWVWNQLTMKERPEFPDTMRVGLEHKFLQDREDLSQIFPGHDALDLCYPFAPK